MGRTLTLALFFALSACSSGLEIAVDVRTDLVAGDDFDGVRVSLDGTQAPLHHARLGELFASPRRVAEFSGIESGRRAVLVELLRGSEIVLSRRLAVRVDESVIVLAVLTRDCRGVVCPGSGARAGETECLGGRCVDPECSSLDLALCGAGECLVDADCTSATACVSPTCVEGACLELPNPAACTAGEYCQPAAGCLPLPDMDAGAGPGPDAGLRDAGPADAGPTPECATSADCGATGLVECVAQRCVFCAASGEPLRELRAGADLHADIDLSIHPRPAAPPQVIVTTQGMVVGVASQAHIYEIDAPSTATASDLSAAIQGGCFEDSVVSANGISVDASDETTMFAAVARSTRGLVTHLNWSRTEGPIDSAGFTCRSRGEPADVLGGTVLFTTRVSSGGGMTVPRITQVTRELLADGTTALGAYTYPYANEYALQPTSVTTAPYARMAHAGRWAIVSAPTDEEIVMFDPGVGGTLPSRVPTPGRTGWLGAVALVDGNPGTYLLAFPIGASVRFVTLGCDTRCVPMGESADLRTSAMLVDDARLAMIGDVPVLLTSELSASGERTLVLRVLRASRVSFDAPGGGRALVIDRLMSGQTLGDIEIEAHGSMTQRYALAWSVSSPGSTSVRTQSFVATCTP